MFSSLFICSDPSSSPAASKSSESSAFPDSSGSRLVSGSIGASGFIGTSGSVGTSESTSPSICPGELSLNSSSSSANAVTPIVKIITNDNVKAKNLLNLIFIFLHLHFPYSVFLSCLYTKS